MSDLAQFLKHTESHEAYWVVTPDGDEFMIDTQGGSVVQSDDPYRVLSGHRRFFVGVIARLLDWKFEYLGRFLRNGKFVPRQWEKPRRHSWRQETEKQRQKRIARRKREAKRQKKREEQEQKERMKRGKI